MNDILPDVPNPSRAAGIEGIRQRRAERVAAFGGKPLTPWFVMEDFHKKLLTAEVDLFLAATGAGAGIQQDLWGPPGASSFLKGTAFPYDQGEMDEFLGLQPPTGYCSEATSIYIANQAFVRSRQAAWRAGQQDRAAIGIGVTASVASNRAHRGDHRAFIAVVSTLKQGSFTRRILLPKDVGEVARAQDEHIVRLATIEVLQAALGLIEPQIVEAEPLSEDNIRTIVMTHPYYVNGRRAYPVAIPRYIFLPGTFNPITDAHREMAHVASTLAPRREVVYTINVDPVHKPSLKGTDLLDKLAMFRSERARAWDKHIATSDEPKVLFTQGEPLFIDKLTKNYGSSWLIGADTLARLLDPKWGPSTSEVLKTISDTESTLYVFPCEWEGRRITAREVLNNRSILPQSDGPMPSNIVDIQHDVANVRSSQIRDERARARAIQE